MQRLPWIAALLAACLSLPLPALAQEMFGSYYTALGPQDFYNSSGRQLTDFGAILQQDRANFHRFNRRDASDEGDPFFANRDLRAAIPALFAAGDNAWWRDRVTPVTQTRGEADVLVILCGRGGRLTHLIVNHANGDGYTTCRGRVTAGD
ncbi:MAG: hypothetical protein AAF646_16450 [Pseudomonadota bacterium]